MGAESEHGNKNGTGTTRTLTVLMAVALGLLLVSVAQSIPSVQQFVRSLQHDEHHHVTSIEEMHTLPPPPAPSEVFMVVEQMPELVGGLAGLAEKVRYPDVAKRAGVQGRVFLQFVVDKDGSVVNPIVVRGIGSGCDEAALDALRASTFTPGMQRGKTVAVKMSLPVVFRLK
jgi:TonB family protein